MKRGEFERELRQRLAPVKTTGIETVSIPDAGSFLRFKFRYSNDAPWRYACVGFTQLDEKLLDTAANGVKDFLCR